MIYAKEKSEWIREIQEKLKKAKQESTQKKQGAKRAPQRNNKGGKRGRNRQRNIPRQRGGRRTRRQGNPRNRINLNRYNGGRRRPLHIGIGKYLNKDGSPLVKSWGTEGHLSIGDTGFEKHETTDSMSIKGTEFVGTITVDTSLAKNPTQLGENLFCLPFSPSFLDSTRLAKLTELFQVYEYEYMVFYLIPVIPATQSGAVIVGTTFDPDYSLSDIPAGDRYVRVLLSMRGFMMAQVFEHVSVSWQPTVQDGLWSRSEGTDARFSIPGTLLVASASTYSSFDGQSTSQPLYNIMCLYKLRFERRGLEVPQTIPTATQVQFNSVQGAVVSDMFFLPAAVTVENQKVCLKTTIGISNLLDPAFICVCTVRASTETVGYTGWSHL